MIDSTSKAISITHSDASKLKSLLEKSTGLKAAAEKSSSSSSVQKPEKAKEKKAASTKKNKWLESDDEEEEEKEEEPKPVEKKAAPQKKSKWFAESDEEEEEEEEEKPELIEKKAAPQKKSKWFADSEDEEEEEEEEKPKPVEKKSTTTKKSKWFAESDEEEEEEKPAEKKAAPQKKSKWFAESDEEEEEEKPVEKKAAPQKKSKWFAESDEEEEEEEEEKPELIEKKAAPQKKSKWFAESDEEEEEEEKPKPAEKKSAASKKSKWFADSEDEEEEEEAEEAPAAKPAAKKAEPKKNKWFGDSDEESASEEEGQGEAQRQKGAKKEKGGDEAAGATAQEPDEEESKPKELHEMNAEEISCYLDELRANRAKKGTEGGKQVKAIERIIPYAKSDEQKITVLLAYFEASFDTALRSQNGCMSKANWNSCMRYFREILSTVAANKAIRLNESEQTNDSTAVIRAAVRNKTSVFKGAGGTPALKSPTPGLKTPTPTPTPVPAPSPAAGEGAEGAEIGMSPFALLQHFADDLRAYNLVERAEDSTGTLVDTALRVKAYYEELAGGAEDGARAELLNKAALVGCLVIENTYFLYEAPAGENVRRLKELTDFAFAHLQGDQQRAKARVMLCGVYNAALHDDYVHARNDFVGSRIQETIASADASTQVLYFRALAQLGLAAFRKGHLPEAHGCLAELSTGGGALAAEYRNRQTVRSIGARELLGQGMVQLADKRDRREEFAEQQRQVPASQHISLSLIEDVHLLSGMLLEVPLLAAQRSSARKYQSVVKEQCAQREQVVSPTVRKLLSAYDQLCCKPAALQTREHIMVAADCMRRGDWERCAAEVAKLSLWTLLPQQQTVQAVRDMVTERIKVECFRCFLFSRANYYTALSIDRLAARFGLGKDKVKTLTYKMIISERFDAHVDYQRNAIIPTTVSVLPAGGERGGRRVLPTKAQSAALRGAESLFKVCENACRLFEAQFDKTVPDVVYKKKTFSSVAN